MEVLIEEMCDRFAILLYEDGELIETYDFNQEDSVRDLVEVFQVLGCLTVKYKEVY